MSASATQLLWLAAGRPDPRKPVHEADASCFWCGVRVSEGCRVRDVCGSSFTDHDVAAVPTSPWVCVPCTWTMTGRPPDTLRLWSVIYREDREAAPSHEKAPNLGPRLHLQNKADPSEFDALLREPPYGPWIASVADSGKIHVVPFARINRGRRWCVRFERHDVRSTSEEYSRVADATQALYDAGFSKGDIEHGPSPSRLLRCGVELWRANDELLLPYRGGALFQLVMFLMRKKEK